MFMCYNRMRKWLSLAFLLPAFVACEKDIDFRLDQTSPTLVVDATIENGMPPRVVLSNSLDYFGKLSLEKLRSSFVRKARVSISTGPRTYALREDSVRINTIYLYFYTTDSLVGTLTTAYNLRVEHNGQSYSASTTIPAITRRIDSIWWEKVPAFDDSTLARMMIRATDRPGLGDYIRYFTKTNSEPLYPGFNSSYDDQIIDGKTYTVQVDRGVNKNAENNDTSVYFRRGDTAILKLCNIDKTTYEFWRTFEFNYQSVGNPFSSPIKVLGNISNGALGYFGGYAAQYRTLIIPK